MELLKDYYEDEIRDGFYVPSIMKRAWAATLEVLGEVDRICKKYNIQYFAQWGTLLGAIRHHGFIPWDDDLDIGMKREDYNKFIKVAPGELRDEYDILGFQNDPEFESFLIRVINSRLVHMEDEWLEKFHEFPYVVGIDIFPWDYINRDEQADSDQITIITAANSMARALDTGIDVKEAKECVRELEKMCNKKFNRSKNLSQQLRLFADEWCGKCKKEQADYITLMPLRTEGSDYKFPKEYLDEFIMIPFENTFIPVPLEYDKILSRSYGNYMKPVHNWDSHEYPFYTQMEDDMIAICGTIPYLYEVPDYSELMKIKNYRAPKSSENLDKVYEILNLLKEAHMAIEKAVMNQDITNTMILLENCQQTAIAIGTILENYLKDCITQDKDCGAVSSDIMKIVEKLEEYCETIYQYHEAIMQQSDSYNLDNNYDIQMINQIEDIEQSIRQLDCKKKEVVFLVYKPEYFGVYKEKWEEECKKENQEVYVIQIPYYEKKFKREMYHQHYDIEGYPDGVIVTPYGDYDFEIHRPDVVYIQNPFDEYNTATSIQPYHYTSHIRPFVDKIVYIPYLIGDEIDCRDERAIKMMDYYVKMPGVLLADEIIVPSDNWKKQYIEILVRVLGEKARAMLEQQIRVDNRCCDDNYLFNFKVPEEWEKIIPVSEYASEKIILYYVSVSSLIHYQEKMIEKIEKLFQFIQGYKEKITILWYDDLITKEVLQKKYPYLFEQYYSLIEEYKSKDWIIFDDSGDVQRAICYSKAYYGDSGIIMNQFCETGKLVMQQVVENDIIYD